ncbi:MAG: Ig-like domain repeat protein [Terracidiphilus sp.]
MAALLLATSGAWAQNGVFSAPQPVGIISIAQNVTVTSIVTGTVQTVEVLTLGASGLDFAGVPISSTCANGFQFTLGVKTCTESVTFKPTAPGLRAAAVVLLDGGGSVLATAYLSGIGLGGLGVLVPGNILPVAGDGQYKDAVSNNISAIQAELYLPSGVTVDGAGNLYIADTLHNMIRMVCGKATTATISGTTCSSAGIITTIAGKGSVGYGGDSGPAADATLSSPSGVALDGAGNLYIADTGNNAVRMISAATGNITTVAGNGTPGYRLADDGGLATLAELYAPESVTLDSRGNLYIADTDNQRIRRVDAISGIITTVAGDGTPGYRLADDGGLATKAELNFPDAVAFDSQGNWYIADSLNNRIREVNALTGNITTFAGSGVTGYRVADNGGPAIAAEMDAPSGVAVDPAGNVYIADTQNNAIRKVSSAASSAPGIISTIAINGVGESYISSLVPPFAQVNIHGPLGLFLDSSANLFFADALNMTIREIQSNFVALDFTALGTVSTRQGTTSGTQDQTVENDGNAALNLTAPDIFVDTDDPLGFPNAALDATATTCPQGNPFLAALDDDCVIGAVFAPSLSLTFGVGVSSMPLDADIDIGKSGDTVNSPLVIELIGNAAPLNSTMVALTSSLNPSDFGQSVTFTATVTTGTGTLSTSSTVTFFDGATQLGVVDVSTSGVATFTISTLTVGLHPITATYSGDSQHFGSTGTLTPKPKQEVDEATATVLQSSGSPSVLGASVTFTATVTTPAGGGVPLDGTVTFTSGAVNLCSNVTLTFAAGTYSATCSTAALPQGSDTITAIYSGDAAKYILGSSATLPQDVQASSTPTLVSNPNPSFYGNTVTFTITVPTVGSTSATGIIKIFDTIGAGPAIQIGTVTLVAGNSGIITFPTSSLPVSTIALPDKIMASYVGDSNYAPLTSNTVNQVVNKATTSTAVSSLPNTGIAGGAEAITATVTVIQGVSTPSGNVTFTADGTTNLGTIALNGVDTATVNPTLALGPHTITANYVGDADDATSTGNLPLSVVQAVTTTTLTSSGSPSLVFAPVTFTAVVASIGGGVPTGSVIFTETPSGGTATPLTCTNPNAGTLVAGIATCTNSSLAPGTYSITATYTGDTNDVGSISSPFSQVVGQIPTLTGLGSATIGTGASQQLILVATVVNVTTYAGPLPIPTGTVTFYLNSITGTQLGSIPLDSTGVATLPPENLTAGTNSIIAVYSGDTSHLPSTSILTTVNNTTAFTLTVTPPSVSVATTQSVTVTVTLTSLNGFTDSIGLGCASLPAGVNCHFSTPTITLPANGTENVSLTIDTNNPLGGGSSAMNARPASRGVSLAGLFLPLGVFFGLVFRRFRRRNALAMTTGLVLLLGVAAMLVSSCGGFSQSSATPGTYVIQVTGVGSSSDILRYQNENLTITQ